MGDPTRQPEIIGRLLLQSGPLSGHRSTWYFCCLAGHTVHWSQVRCDPGKWKETQGAVGTADMFTLSRQQQLGVFIDFWYTKTDKSGPWPSGRTGAVLPRSAISLFTKQKLWGCERVGQEEPDWRRVVGYFLHTCVITTHHYHLQRLPVDAILHWTLFIHDLTLNFTEILQGQAG